MKIASWAAFSLIPEKFNVLSIVVVVGAEALAAAAVDNGLMGTFRRLSCTWLGRFPTICCWGTFRLVIVGPDAMRVTIFPFTGSTFASKVVFGAAFLFFFFGRIMRRSGVAEAEALGCSSLLDRCFLLTINPLLITLDTTSLAADSCSGPPVVRPLLTVEVVFFFNGDESASRDRNIPELQYR